MLTKWNISKQIEFPDRTGLIGSSARSGSRLWSRFRRSRFNATSSRPQTTTTSTTTKISSTSTTTTTTTTYPPARSQPTIRTTATTFVQTQQRPQQVQRVRSDRGRVEQQQLPSGRLPGLPRLRAGRFQTPKYSNQVSGNIAPFALVPGEPKSMPNYFD